MATDQRIVEAFGNIVKYNLSVCCSRHSVFASVNAGEILQHGGGIMVEENFEDHDEDPVAAAVAAIESAVAMAELRSQAWAEKISVKPERTRAQVREDLARAQKPYVFCEEISAGGVPIKAVVRCLLNSILEALNKYEGGYYRNVAPSELSADYKDYKVFLWVPDRKEIP